MTWCAAASLQIREQIAQHEIAVYPAAYAEDTELIDDIIVRGQS